MHHAGGCSKALAGTHYMAAIVTVVKDKPPIKKKLKVGFLFFSWLYLHDLKHCARTTQFTVWIAISVMCE